MESTNTVKKILMYCPKSIVLPSGMPLPLATDAVRENTRATTQMMQLITITPGRPS